MSQTKGHRAGKSKASMHSQEVSHQSKSPKTSRHPKIRKPTKDGLKQATFSKRGLLSFALVFAIVGGYIILKAFAAGDTANIYVDTNGGSCTRSASLVSYNDSTACGSLDAANDICQNGDLVIVKGGTYPEQSVTGGNSRTSMCTMRVAASETATIGVDNANCTLCDVVSFNMNAGAQWITFDGFVAAYGKAEGGRTNQGRIEADSPSDHLTFQNMDTGPFAFRGSNFALLNDDLGPGDWPSNARLDTVNGFTMDNSTLHDIETPDSTHHIECLTVETGVQNVTISNSVFHNCSDFSIFSKPSAGTPVNHFTIQNSIFWHNNGSTRSNEVKFTDSGGGGCNHISLLYNYFQDNVYTGECSDGVVTVGNIFSANGSTFNCETTWDYNVALDGADLGDNCGKHATFTTSTAAKFNNAAAGDFHLLSGSSLIDKGSPTNFPLTDKDGNARPAGAGPDAGPYEFGSSGGVTAVNISANPTDIVSGQTSTLTWNSANATSCTASGAWSGSKATSGTQNVSPTSTSTYTLMCTGTNGSASNSATVTVTPVAVTLDANPTSIISGQSSTLTWSSTNATSCTASGDWSGSKATSGNQSVSPTSDATYNLSCSDGSGNSANDTATVTVSAANSSTPLASYNFDEGTGTTAADSSGNNNTATLTSATWAAGKNSNGLSVNGTSGYASAPSSSTLNIGANGTIEAWFKPTAINRWHGIIAKGNANSDSSHNYSMEVNNANNLQCAIGNGTTAVTTEGSTTLAANTFYHLACVWNGTNLLAYVNGTQVGSSAQSVQPASNSSALFIGQFGGSSDFAQGVIDDVRIYNIALSGAQVTSDMNTAVSSGGGGGTSTPGDCNADAHVTVIDLSILLSHYAATYAPCDFNSDGTVNIIDLSTLLSHYGT